MAPKVVVKIPPAEIVKSDAVAPGGDVTNIVRWDGNDYATLDNRDPTTSAKSVWNYDIRLPLPPGWETCPSDVNVAKNVIARFQWGSDVLLCRNGDGWPTNQRGGGQPQLRCTYPLDYRDGAYKPQRRGIRCSILIRLMPVPPALLTLHLEEQEDGSIAISVTDMGGAEVAAFQARADDLLGDQRPPIAKQMNEDRPGMIQLLAPDGRLLTGADDPKRLAELLVHVQPEEDAM